MKKSDVEDLVDKELAKWGQFSVSHVEHRAQRITSSCSLGHDLLLFSRPLHPDVVKEDLAYLAESELARQFQTSITKDLDVSSALILQLRMDLHLAKKRRLDAASLMRRILHAEFTPSPFPNGGEPPRILTGWSSNDAAAAGPSTSSAIASTSTGATVPRVVDQALSIEQSRMGELPADTLLWLLSLIESQVALTRLEHAGKAAEYAEALLRFAQNLSHSKAVDVAQVRTSMVSRSTRGTIPHEVPFSFVDYSVAGVTRFLVDFHFLETAINFEDSGRRVNIALVDFGMESATSADPNSTRKAFKKELEYVPYFNAPPRFPLLPPPHNRWLSHYRIRRVALGDDLPLTLATCSTSFDAFMRRHRHLRRQSDTSAGRVPMKEGPAEDRLGYDTALAPMVPATGNVCMPLIA